MVLPAPPRLSMITLWPSVGEIWLATSRAITSTGPPAGVGTMMCTTRLGYLSCAAAPCGPSGASRRAMAAASARLRVSIVSLMWQMMCSGVGAQGFNREARHSRSPADRLLQDAHHVGVAAGAGVVDCGLALAILDVAVGAGRDQGFDRIDMR